GERRPGRRPVHRPLLDPYDQRVPVRPADLGTGRAWPYPDPDAQGHGPQSAPRTRRATSEGATATRARTITTPARRRRDEYRRTQPRATRGRCEPGGVPGGKITPSRRKK